MSNDHFTLYAWRLSWYSAKVRSYLQYKGIPFNERKPSLYQFKYVIAKHVGDAVVPVVVSPEGEWLQDSTQIIARLEERFPAAPVYPATPLQRLFSDLVEIWADEFWHPTAEHYRFSFPENFPVWREELSTLLPGFPKPIQHALVKHFYQYMLGVTEQVGVVADKLALIERWSEQQLDALEQHFSRLPFLLGGRATLGDFALMGPIFGHLAFDPRSRQVLIEPRPHLAAWLVRMSSRAPADGELLADDQLPQTLQPLLSSLFGELLPYLQLCAQSVRGMGPQAPGDKRFARLGAPVQIPFGAGSLKRMVIPYSLWMLQRVQDRVAQCSERDAVRSREWLQAMGGEGLLGLEFPRLRRLGLHVAAEIATPG